MAVRLFDAATGELLWESPAYPSWQLLTAAGGKKSVLFTGVDTLRKVDLVTGKLDWEYRIPSALNYVTALIGEQYIVLSFTGNEGESIFIYLDNSSGEEKYRFNAEGSPRFIIGDSVITFRERSWRCIAPPQS